MSSTFEDLADDNDKLQQLAEDALQALKEGRTGDLLNLLERMAEPKWGAAWHCKEQYNLELAR